MAQLLDILQEVDLNRNEAMVYLELLSKGCTNVRPLIERTKLHRQQVYTALQKLTELKLATEVAINNQKHFQANSPDALLERAEEKKRKIEQYLPELVKLRVKGEDALEVRLLHGKEGLQQNVREFVEIAAKTDKRIKVIANGKASDYYDAMGDYQNNFNQMLDSGGIIKEIIAPDVAPKDFMERASSSPYVDLRVLPAGMSTPAYTRIATGMVATEIYSSEPVVIQVRNKAISQHYMDHFANLWKQATTYKTAAAA